MMTTPPLSREMTQRLLELAGRQLGESPQTVHNALRQGDLAGLGLAPGLAAQIQQALSDPQNMQEILHSPKVQVLLRQLEQK